MEVDQSAAAKCDLFSSSSSCSSTAAPALVVGSSSNHHSISTSIPPALALSISARTSASSSQCPEVATDRIIFNSDATVADSDNATSSCSYAPSSLSVSSSFEPSLSSSSSSSCSSSASDPVLPPPAPKLHKPKKGDRLSKELQSNLRQHSTSPSATDDSVAHTPAPTLAGVVDPLSLSLSSPTGQDGMTTLAVDATAVESSLSSDTNSPSATEEPAQQDEQHSLSSSANSTAGRSKRVRISTTRLVESQITARDIKSSNKKHKDTQPDVKKIKREPQDNGAGDNADAASSMQDPNQLQPQEEQQSIAAPLDTTTPSNSGGSKKSKSPCSSTVTSGDVPVFDTTVAGNFHGRAKRIFDDTSRSRWKGWIVEGEWKRSQIHCLDGESRLIADPRVFYQDKRHGDGTLTYADGARIRGRWRHGVWTHRYDPPTNQWVNLKKGIAACRASVPPLCTFTATKAAICVQNWFYCFTCVDRHSAQADSSGVCESCAERCHAGHELVASNDHQPWMCDCGADQLSSPCRALTKRTMTDDEVMAIKKQEDAAQQAESAAQAAGAPEESNVTAAIAAVVVEGSNVSVGAPDGHSRPKPISRAAVAKSASVNSSSSSSRPKLEGATVATKHKFGVLPGRPSSRDSSQQNHSDSLEDSSTESDTEAATRYQHLRRNRSKNSGANREGHPSSYGDSDSSRSALSDSEESRRRHHRPGAMSEDEDTESDAAGGDNNNRNNDDTAVATVAAAHSSNAVAAVEATAEASEPSAITESMTLGEAVALLSHHIPADLADETSATSTSSSTSSSSTMAIDDATLSSSSSRSGPLHTAKSLPHHQRLVWATRSSTQPKFTAANSLLPSVPVALVAAHNSNNQSKHPNITTISHTNGHRSGTASASHHQYPQHQHQYAYVAPTPAGSVGSSVLTPAVFAGFGLTSNHDTATASGHRLSISKQPVCDVCKRPTAPMTDSSCGSNPLLHCTLCTLDVHQNCYYRTNSTGGTDVTFRSATKSNDSISWKCLRCADGSLTALNASCVLCPSTAVSGAMLPTVDDKWCHIACVLWIRGLRVRQGGTVQCRVYGVSDVLSKWRRMACVLCKSKEGAGVTCAHPSCSQAFHVSCAQLAEFVVKLDSATNSYSALCAEHSAAERGAVSVASRSLSPPSSSPYATSTSSSHSTQHHHRHTSSSKQHRRESPTLPGSIAHPAAQSVPSSRKRSSMAVCDVCHSEKPQEGTAEPNPMLVCVGCQLYLHHQCYGFDRPLPDVRPGWRCERCVVGKRALSSHCAVCPANATKGAMRRTVENAWCHVVCAFWLGSLYFTSDGRIGGVQDTVQRWQTVKQPCCFLCGQTDGAGLQCAQPFCQNVFHVSCAHESRLLPEKVNSISKQCVYCPQHTMLRKHQQQHRQDKIQQQELQHHQHQQLPPSYHHRHRRSSGGSNNSGANSPVITAVHSVTADPTQFNYDIQQQSHSHYHHYPQQPEPRYTHSQSSSISPTPYGDSDCNSKSGYDQTAGAAAGSSGVSPTSVEYPSHYHYGSCSYPQQYYGSSDGAYYAPAHPAADDPQAPVSHFDNSQSYEQQPPLSSHSSNHSQLPNSDSNYPSMQHQGYGTAAAAAAVGYSQHALPTPAHPTAASAPQPPAAPISTPSSITSSPSSADDLARRSVASWSETDVAAWLSSLSRPLAVYGPAFLDGAVNGEMLLGEEFTREMLALLCGCSGMAVLHQSRIWAEVQKLRAANSISGTTPSTATGSAPSPSMQAPASTPTGSPRPHSATTTPMASPSTRSYAVQSANPTPSSSPAVTSPAASAFTDLSTPSMS